MAFLRAREAAGNRVRSLARRDKAVSEAIRGVPAREIPATLGADTVHRTNGNGSSPGFELDLVSGAREALLDAFRVWRLDAALADELAETILGHAARTLYERNASLPASFQNYVRGLITAGRS